MSQSKAYWLDLLQHTIRITATAMVASVTVSSAGTASGYLPVTQVDWLGGLYIGLTSALITILIGLTSIVIPGADPNSISFFPPKTPPAPVEPAPVVPVVPVAPKPPSPAPPVPPSPYHLP